jgi:ApbE superfamily uncharacterized protein (UPF0280 family)
MKPHAIWATALVLCVAAVAHASSQYEIEQAKQTAFMMKACADAGGDWSVHWNRPNCLRPRQTGER